LFQVQHNGVEFEVVQTASPTGRKWTVQILGKRTKTGRAPSRALAMIYARTAIEKAIKVKRQPKPTRQ
jgi:hypothetical protein